MNNDVVRRLKSLGYIVVPADNMIVECLIGKVTNTIRNECNVDTIPEGLRHVAVDMVCGEFLLAKKGSGQLDGFDVDAAVKQIHEGDTTITFAVADNSVTIDGLIDFLMNSGKSQFVTYRRMRW